VNFLSRNRKSFVPSINSPENTCRCIGFSVFVTVFSASGMLAVREPRVEAGIVAGVALGRWTIAEEAGEAALVVVRRSRNLGFRLCA